MGSFTNNKKPKYLHQDRLVKKAHRKGDCFELIKPGRESYYYSDKDYYIVKINNEEFCKFRCDSKDFALNRIFRLIYRHYNSQDYFITYTHRGLTFIQFFYKFAVNIVDKQLLSVRRGFIKRYDMVEINKNDMFPTFLEMYKSKDSDVRGLVGSMIETYSLKEEDEN